MDTTAGIDDLRVFSDQPPNGWLVQYFTETPSTNSIAMEQGRAGAMAGTIVLAETQTDGRGRLGKEWQSFAGCGLYVSIILRPKLDLDKLSQITLAAGVALVETAASFVTEKPMLKWPNDLLINGQKCGGILAESDVRNIHSPLVVLGIGVNIHEPKQGYGENLRVKAGSINEFSSGPISRVDFLQQLIMAVQGVVTELENNQFQNVLRRWRDYDYIKGKHLTWLTTAGLVVEGLCSGINDDGLLFITDAGGTTHEVLSGDVQLTKNMV